MTGKQKAAIVLLNLDRKTAASVVKSFSHAEIVELGLAMSEMENIRLDKGTVEEILGSFMREIVNGGFLVESSQSLSAILSDALGENRAKEIMGQLSGKGRVRPFESLREIESTTLSGILQSEHPQTIALVLAHLDTEKTAEILKDFPEDKQMDVIQRLLTMDEAAIDAMQQIGEMILKRLAAWSQDRFVKQDLGDRVRNIADVLNILGDSASKPILGKISETAPDMAEKIKDHMFVFDDLIGISQNHIRNILTQVDTKTMALALKGVSRELTDHILGALSRRIREIVRDEKEMLGLVPIEQVAEGQRQIIQIARELIEEGKIELSKGTEKKMVE